MYNAMSFLVNNYCNANCSYCHLKIGKYFSNSKNNMPLNKFQTYVRLMNNIFHIREIYIAGSEPLLWPYLDEAISFLKKNNFKTILGTNALIYKEVYPDNMEIHLDYHYLRNNEKNIPKYINLLNSYGGNLTFVMVVDDSPDTKDIDFYFNLLSKYIKNIDGIGISQVTPDRFNKKGKISVNKAIYLYKRLFSLHKNIMFMKPIPICLVNNANYEFFLKNLLLKNKEVCYIGKKEFFVGSKGEIYLCMGFMQFKLSLSEFLNEKIRNNKLMKLEKFKNNMPKEECYECKWYKEKLCQGGCLDRYCNLFNH